jgi:hypothetical protein
VERPPEHAIWRSIKGRCLGRSEKERRLYGAVGMDPSWARDFEAFFLAVGSRPSPRHLLARLDKRRGYESGNVAWLTPAESNERAERGDWRVVEYGGEQRRLVELARERGLPLELARGRLERGESVEEALGPGRRRPPEAEPSRVGTEVELFLVVGAEKRRGKRAARYRLRCKAGGHEVWVSAGKIEAPGLCRRCAAVREPCGLRLERRLWQVLVTRCTRPGSSDYRFYGGAGIRICERWRESFEAFLADVGLRPSKAHCFALLDKGRGYQPGAAAWVPKADAAALQGKAKVYTHEGVTLSAGGWARRLGLKVDQVQKALKRGRSIGELVLLAKPAPVGREG